MKDFTILFDGEPTTLKEFIAANTAPGVDTPPEEEMDAVKGLKPGEQTALAIGGGVITIERPYA